MRALSAKIPDMKAEIIQKFDTLLQTEDLNAIKQEVRDLRDSYNALTREEQHAQQEKWNAEEHEEGQDFAFVPAEEDERFEALLVQYKERVREQKEKIAAGQKANFEAKNTVLNELEALIRDEENVGKAFEVFKELNERWSSIGDIPGDKLRDLQDRHQRLRDDFFYNINIYKELREHDLKVNLRRKEELIELARGLVSLEGIHEIEMLARSYQKQWSEIGPSPRETWKEIGDTFFGLIRDGFGKVQAHYDELRAGQEENLQKKRDLVDQLRQIVSLEVTNHSTWTKKTEEVIEFQKAWKESGYASKAESEEIWKSFRALCDQFFERKNLYYDDRKKSYKDNQVKKEALIAQANALKESNEWKKSTEALIKLQEEWKSLGAASQAEERKLWTQFRAACDHFFTAKKGFFAGMDDRHEANEKEKQGIIAELEAFELTGARSADMEALRALQTRWNAVGHVSKASMKPLSERFFGLLDAKWDVLKADKADRAISQYKDRIDTLREGSEGDLKRERRILREKIDRLQQRVVQYENNLNFFTGPGAAEMVKGVEKKIRAAKDEIDEIRQKLRLFDAAN